MALPAGSRPSSWRYSKARSDQSDAHTRRSLSRIAGRPRTLTKESWRPAKEAVAESSAGAEERTVTGVRVKREGNTCGDFSSQLFRQRCVEKQAANPEPQIPKLLPAHLLKRFAFQQERQALPQTGGVQEVFISEGGNADPLRHRQAGTSQPAKSCGLATDQGQVSGGQCSSDRCRAASWR